ncbi:uncharacterized protein LOC118435630 isoform X2 [Folsomia candida]|nr:uncharacterized protein LOC118435630 isoform X2 [Folsomia candida]
MRSLTYDSAVTYHYYVTYPSDLDAISAFKIDISKRVQLVASASSPGQIITFPPEFTYRIMPILSQALSVKRLDMKIGSDISTKFISPSDVDEWTKLCRKVFDVSPSLEELCLEVPVLPSFSWFPVEERLTCLKILRLDILPATSEWGNDAMAKIIMEETPNLVTFTSSYFGTGLHTSILKLLTGSDEFWPKLTNIGCPRKQRREGYWGWRNTTDLDLLAQVQRKWKQIYFGRISTNQLEQVKAVLEKHCETVELIELNPVLSLRLVPMELPRMPNLKKLAIWEYDVSEYELYSLFSQIYKMPRGVVEQNVAPCNDWSREKLDFFNLFDLFGDSEKFKDRFPSLHTLIFTVPSGRYKSYVYNAIFPKKKIASLKQICYLNVTYPDPFGSTNANKRAQRLLKMFPNVHNKEMNRLRKELYNS